MSGRPDVRHIYRLVGGGGEDHELAINEAAVIFARAGYKTHDMTVFTASPYRPDLIVERREQVITNTGNTVWKSIVSWVEIVDTSMPPRDFVKLPNPLIRIDIGKCRDANERIAELKRVIV